MEEGGLGLAKNLRCLVQQCSPRAVLTRRCIFSAQDFGLGLAYTFIPVHHDLCMQMLVRLQEPCTATSLRQISRQSNAPEVLISVVLQCRRKTSTSPTP